MSKQNVFMLGCLTAAFCLAASGCNSFNAEPEKIAREAVAASGNLADTLASVRDKDSAEASVAVLDERFTAMIAAFKRLPELQTTYKDTPVDKATVDQFSLKFQSNLARIQREEERLKRIPGLPVAFWKVVKLHGFEMIEVAFSMEGGLGGQADYLNFLRTVRTLYDHNRFEEIVMVDFNGMPSNLAQETRDKLLKLAPGATLYHFTRGTVEEIVIGPVKDFHAFIASLDMGTVTYEDQARGAVEIQVNWHMLTNGRAEALRKARLARQENPAQPGKKEPARTEEQQARMKEMQERMAARMREFNGPDPGDPAYLEKMADRMSSENLGYKNQAIDALLKADPASASPEAKKKVARAFKALAEDNDTFDRQKAVRGLVKWAGTYSVPILLKMLNSGNPFDEEAVLRALAELKDARGAPALAKRLKDFRLKEVARDGLVAMGSGAEDAVLALANTDDADLYNTVIALLGDVGTEKCLDVLRQAQTSRDRKVRFASMAAVAKVNRRRFAAQAKAKAKAAEEEPQ